MERLCGEYVDLLKSGGPASRRFWALEKRIRRDCRKTGVVADVRRSRMIEEIGMLLYEGAIERDDLREFNEDLRLTVRDWGSHPK